MQFIKNIIGLLCAIMMVANILSAEESLYVISNVDTGELKAYEIDGNSLTYSGYGYANDFELIGIAIHKSDYGNWLFCTFEGLDKIQLIDAQILNPDGQITVPNAYNLAGIVADNDKSKLYVVDRFTNHLWSYSWNPMSKTLTPDFENPCYIGLEDISNEYGKGAFGLALDETNGLLYVADNTDGILYYDTDDWSKEGELNVDCNVISVAVDASNQLLYFGSMGSYGEGDPYLYQYNLSTDDIDSVNVGSSVAGIAVDQQTGLVYITTYSDSYGGYLMIYDSDLNRHGTPIWLDSPAGVAVGGHFEPPHVRNINQSKDYTAIQPAIDEANDNDELVVSQGVYRESPDFGSKSLTLKSTDPNNPSVVKKTIIRSTLDSLCVILLMSNNGSEISGFTITNAQSGIYCDSSNPIISHCKIEHNGEYGGISCWWSTATIIDTLINNNNYDGIRSYDSSITVDKCEITDNDINGINVLYGSAVVTNSIIHRNGNGIYLSNCSSSSKIFNNTIVNNSTFGIWRDSGSNPDVNSNIIYYNTSQLNGISDSNVNYNCIENYTGGTNINSNPQFRDANNYDYHLKYNSPCIDMGNPNFSSSTEKDIDGWDRVMDGDRNNTARVDMGFDEFCPYDLVQDEFINFLDFAVFAKAWGTHTGQEDFNDRCDFYDDGATDYINYKDLYVFCEYWLYPSDGIQGEMDMMMQQQESETESIFYPEEEFAESLEEDQSEENQYYYRADYNLPEIYLTCDNNNPEPNDEVTVWIHCDSPLICMGLSIYVAGDANITTAMNEADCNEYGWDNGWRSDPSYLDDIDYWVYLSGVRWDADASGVISYVKFRYNSGQVNISFDQENSMASTWDWESGSGSLVPLSQEAIIVSSDPNDP